MPHTTISSPPSADRPLPLLRRLDMNLLLTFDALMKTRSATASARLLHKTQPAISRELARLRERLQDPLLVVQRSRFVPTERALELHAVVRDALGQIEQALGPAQRFNPRQAEGVVNIGSGGHIEALLAAPLLQHVHRQAPRLTLRFQSVHGDFEPEDLDTERMDIAIGLFQQVAPRFQHCPLLRDRRVCVVSRTHPLARRRRLSLDDLSQLTWFAFSHMHGRETTFDRALRPLHRKMVFSAYLSGFGVAPFVLQDTDLATTMPASVAALYQRHFPLVSLEMPAPLRHMDFSMAWPRRQHTSPLHAWLRAELLDVARQSLPGTVARG